MRFSWSGGLHPWLDVGIQTAERLIGIESKRYEPFRDHKTATFSATPAAAASDAALPRTRSRRDWADPG